MAASTKQSESKALMDEPEVFLAVIIADSYDKSFRPCTLDRSRVLVPLANRPLIDYTLGFLSLAGIEEVIVYCTSYAHKIKSYIENSDWPKCMRIKVIINEDAQSVGDALRDLDDKQMISTDFVLVNGDLVANFDLKNCLETHKNTREKDGNAILTKVMKRCPPNHRVRSPQAMELYAIDKTTCQIFSHMKVGGTSKVKLPTEIIRANPGVQLRYDLLDCHVTICAAMVPSLLTDNFDYQTINDLIHGVLGNQEILGNTMHLNILEEGYAARAVDFYSYKAVSRELVDKWAYPFCPDRNWSGGADLKSYVSKGTGHLTRSKKWSRSCHLGRNVMVGDETSIGDATEIKSSVIGNRCNIGANVEITDSIIWNNVCIEDNCRVRNSVICDRVVLHKGTQIFAHNKSSESSQQCILGGEVILGPDAVINDAVMLTCEPAASEWDDEETAVYKHAGSRGKAYEYTLHVDDEESEESDAGSVDADTADDDLITPDTELFYNEVLDTLQRASAEKVGAENIILDINSLKHAYNIQINEVNHMVIQAVLDRPITSSTTSSKLLSSLKPLLKLCMGVFKNYYRSQRSQLECLQAIQEFVSEESHQLWLPIISQVIMYFYQNDVLDEELITSWYKGIPTGPFKLEVSKLIEWFQEADSESD